MNPSWTDAMIVYCLGGFVAPALPRGALRRACEVLYAPFWRLGLWYRWSMYAPDVPKATQLGVVGVRLSDGAFEEVELPGFDGARGLGRAWGLRFIALQWALCDPLTDHLKPCLADRALRAWRERPVDGPEARAVAVEVRMLRFASPEPGGGQPAAEPEITTLWSAPVTE